MLRFKQFITEENEHEKGVTVDMWLHPTKKTILNIFNYGVPFNEAKDWSLPTVTSRSPFNKSITGRIRSLTPDAVTLPRNHFLREYSTFKPETLSGDDRKDLLENHERHKELMANFHLHLASHGLYSASDKDPMHKTPQMQKFEDGVSNILGDPTGEGRSPRRKKFERWHTDSNSAAGDPKLPAPRDAAVYSSSNVSTYVGKKVKVKGTDEYEDKPFPRLETGTVHVFDDYGKPLAGTVSLNKKGDVIPKGDSIHRAPDPEERGDRTFIRAHNIKRFDMNRGIPKKGGGYYPPTIDGMNEYIGSKENANTENIHNNLHKKIIDFVKANPNPEYHPTDPSLHSVNAKRIEKLKAHINSFLTPIKADGSGGESIYNKGGWFEKLIKSEKQKAIKTNNVSVKPRPDNYIGGVIPDGVKEKHKGYLDNLNANSLAKKAEEAKKRAAVAKKRATKVDSIENSNPYMNS